MPPLTGVSYGLSNLIQGVIQGQSPQGQRDRIGAIAAADELYSSRRVRNFIKDFDWTQEDAPTEAFKGLASIDKFYAAPLINLVEKRTQDALQRERFKVLESTIKERATDDFSVEDYLNIRGTERGLGLEPTTLIDPFDPNELQGDLMLEAARRRTRMTPSGDEDSQTQRDILKYAQFLQEQGVAPEETAEALRGLYSTGKLDPTKVSQLSPFKEDDIGRLQDLILSSDEFQNVVSKRHPQLAKGKSLIRALVGLPPTFKEGAPDRYVTQGKEQFLSPEWEETLTSITTGEIPVSPELRGLVENFRRAVGLNKPAGTKREVNWAE